MPIPEHSVDTRLAGEWDAVVVGAGPAGCAAAIRLARVGVRVLLVDRARFPRYKVCGGCLNARAVGALDEMGLGRALQVAGVVPLETFRFRTVYGEAALSMRGGLALSRGRLDAALANAAETAGATFADGLAARIGPVSEGLRAVRLECGAKSFDVSAHAVIVASGLGRNVFLDRTEVRSRVSRQSYLGCGTVVENHTAVSRGCIDMAYGPGGYVGAVQVEDGSIHLAAALDPDRVRMVGGIGRLASEILQRCGSPLAGVAGSAVWHGTPLLTQRSARMAGERWFAVGDAAGYVEPFTGEGIGWALESGLAVSGVAMEAIAGAVSAASERWQAEHSARLETWQQPCRAVRAGLRHPGLVRLATWTVGRAPAVATPVLRQIHALGTT